MGISFKSGFEENVYAGILKVDKSEEGYDDLYEAVKMRDDVIGVISKFSDLFKECDKSEEYEMYLKLKEKFDGSGDND